MLKFFLIFFLDKIRVFKYLYILIYITINNINLLAYFNYYILIIILFFIILIYILHYFY